ncbi:Uncharacterized protein APZ42_002676, partial [Daphnia magna]
GVQVQRLVRNRPTHLRLVRAEVLVTKRRFHSWSNEYYGRRRIETAALDGRLEASPPGLQEHSVDLEDGARPFRQLLERAIATLCQPLPPAGGLEDRRPVAELEGSVGVLLPPVQSDPLLPHEDPSRPIRSSPCGSLLAQPILVSISNGAGDGHSAVAVPVQVAADIPVGGVSSVDHERIDSADRLAALRRCLGERGLSQNVIELVLGAARPNTHATYQSAWVSWSSWCLERTVDPLSAGVNDVLTFLTDYFDSGRSYSTVNVARSMLSSTLSMAGDGTELGKNTLVTNLMKGIYNKRPPLPKYGSTWDPAVVLSHFDSRANTSNELSTLQLSRKSATLLAITSLSRCADLASIRLQSIRFSGQGASFSLDRPRKAQHAGPLHSLSIGAWSQNPAICPVDCLRRYIDRTAALRGESNSELLFIGSNKPHKPVSSSTIGRWIKDQLKEAGID